jgi:hypothetical protein
LFVPLLPVKQAGSQTQDPAQERLCEPDFLARPRPLGAANLDLARLVALFPWLLRDHAPINPITHDGYIERIEALPA